MANVDLLFRQSLITNLPARYKEQIMKKMICMLFLLAFTQAYADSPPNGRSAEVDCRAGCQGKEKGCQESYIGSARLDAKPGKYFDASTLKITSYRNASDSPGLRREPKWIIRRVPNDSSQPTSLIVTPDINTCEGKSPDTQGVTFYTWTATYFD